MTLTLFINFIKTKQKMKKFGKILAATAALVVAFVGGALVTDKEKTTEALKKGYEGAKNACTKPFKKRGACEKAGEAVDEAAEKIEEVLD